MTSAKPTQESLPHEGEWSSPMSLTELASRCGNISARKFKSIAERWGLVRVSRKLWMVRLDSMDRATAYRIQHGRPPLIHQPPQR